MPLRTNTVDFDELSADPSSPSDGQLWYNHAAGQLKARLLGSSYVVAPVAASLWTNTGTAIHPVAGGDDLVIGATAVVGTERLRVVGDTRLEGKLTVTGLIDPTGLLLTGQASAPVAVAANDGLLWVDSGASPSELMFTDDGPSDYVVTTSKITVTAGNGMTGGGPLGAPVTLNIAAGDGSIQINPSSIQVGTIGPGQHGNLTGGTLHNLVSSTSHGFQPQSNRSAVADPTINDDSGAGYAVGSYWVNTSSQVTFVCVDASVGAAVWVTTAATAILTSTAPVDVTKAAAVVGVGTTAARHDHKHDISTGVAVELTDSSNAEGTGTSLARSDHTHAHGNRSGGTLHAAATTGVAGFMSAADKTAVDNLGTTYVPQTRTLTAGAGLTGGGDLTANRTFDVVANADGSIQVNANDIQVGTLASDAQHGNLGNGALHSVATTSVNGFLSAADKTTIDNLGTTYVPQTRTLTAGAGLTGGGDLTANRTFNVVANADGSIQVNANDIQVGVLASDAQHGSRGGGTQHSVATTGVAGFMSASDKTKLDGIGSAATSAILGFGSETIDTTTTARYLFPWYGARASLTTTRQIRVPMAGTLKNLRVRAATAGTGAATLTYTVRKNGVATSLVVAMANTSQDGSDLSNTVSVAAGDLIDIHVAKSATITTSPAGIVASMEVTA